MFGERSSIFNNSKKRNSYNNHYFKTTEFYQTFITMANNNYDSESDSEGESWFCENCDDEIDGPTTGINHWAFGHFDDLCQPCYAELRQTCFVCDQCNAACETETLVEDEAYSNTEHSTCHLCFVDEVIDTLPSPLCDCGKPCPKKNQDELEVQLEKKTDLYEDETPTKHPFHKDCCKGCGIVALLKTRTVTYDNQRVGFLMRLKLGNDPSAVINRVLGGTPVSKLIEPDQALHLNKNPRAIPYRDEDDDNEDEGLPLYRITNLSAVAAKYEMRARYGRENITNDILERLFKLRLLLLK